MRPPSPARHGPASRWRALPERGTVSLFELALFAVAVPMIAVDLPQTLQDLIIQTFLWAGLALAWNIAGGYAGMISFGHAAFFGIGAYTSTILSVHYGITPWIGMWAGALLAAACGGAARNDLRAAARPIFHSVHAGAAEVVPHRCTELGEPDRRRGGTVDPAGGRRNEHGVCLEEDLRRSHARLSCGRAMCSPSCSRARATAIICSPCATTRTPPAQRASIRCWCECRRDGLSAFLTAIGGSLFAQYFLYLDPTHVISPELSFQFALLPALGGLGTAIGPVLGAFMITSAVGTAALLSRPRRRRPASGDLRRRRDRRHAVFPGRHGRRACPTSLTRDRKGAP